MGKIKKNKILEKLGLEVDEVRAAFSVPAPEKPKKKRNYLYRAEQRKMSNRMRKCKNLIFARYESGVHPKTIAKAIGVSEESVRVRLRAAGFFTQS